VLEVGRRHIELPAIVAAFCLKTHGRWFAQQMGLVQPQQGQITIDGRAPQQAHGRLDQALQRLHPMLLHQLDGSPGGQVASGLVGGAQFQRRNQFAIPLQLGLRQHPRLAVVGAVRGVRRAAFETLAAPDTRLLRRRRTGWPRR